MKGMIRIILGILTAAVLMIGCAKGEKTEIVKEWMEEVQEDGGVITERKDEVPPVIVSEDIIDFECEFSTNPYSEEDLQIPNANYRFSAKLQNEKVTGSYSCLFRYGESKELEFEAEPEFMEKLKKIVRVYELAGYNGIFYQVSGLPDMYGARISIRYASGEEIQAFNNEESFLTIACMEALEELFAEYSGKCHTPEILDMSISGEGILEKTENIFLRISYPVITLNAGQAEEISDAEITVNNILEQYNREVRMNQESRLHYGLRPAAKAAAEDGSAVSELYSDVNTYLMRYDEQILSFYEHTVYYEYWLEEQQDWYTFNYDLKEKRELGFEDIFEDAQQLAEILADTFRMEYPELEFPADLEELLWAEMGEENGRLCFAIAWEGVHFFARGHWLHPDPAGQHIMLSFAGYPDLIREPYRDTANNWILELEYDTTYWFGEGNWLRVNREPASHGYEEIFWRLETAEGEYTEQVYGYSPDCRLVCRNGKYYLYREVPTGDLSFATMVYWISEQGVGELGQIPYGFHENRSLNPERILMYDGEPDQEMEKPVIPSSWYCVGEDGMPVWLAEKE